MAQHTAEKTKLLQEVEKFEGAILAGGALTSVFTRQPINDYDIYFKSREAFENALRYAYDYGMWCVDASKRSVTFASGATVHQFMHFDFFPTPADIFACFDFTCCMAAYDFDADELVMHDDFLTHCSQRFLRFNAGTRYPLASAVRVLKYQERGYSIGKGDMTRIAMACRGVKIESWEDLADQIGGAYGDKVALNAEGDFSVEAALAALDPDKLWTPRTADEQPGSADDLIAKLSVMKGEPALDVAA
jgi:hypothetical protein|uniref:Uncharacterized protein n=1 Tax=viral metagenome TaxID=1070528 RepID=A0A6H1ZBA3_9ZZZZ